MGGIGKTGLLVLGVGCIGLMGAPVRGQALREREPLPKGPVSMATAYGQELDEAAMAKARLLVKFVDAARIRSTPSGGLESRTGRDLSAFLAQAALHDVTFSPGVRLPEDRLAALEARAAQRSGVGQPDLAGILEARVRTGSARDLTRVGEALQEAAVVEWAWLDAGDVEPARDVPPATPSLGGLQAYVGPDPGMDFLAARDAGLTGAGVRFSDVEYGWIVEHEDLTDVVVHAQPGKTIHPDVAALGFDHHGTAVLGILAAAVNEYGCTGVVPQADLYTYPIYTEQGGLHTLTAVAAAVAESQAGDVVLLELQTGAGAPVEVSKSLWTVVKAATDAGVVVVAAAGNGGKNLDSPTWINYQGWGDSGAIIVGAGSDDVHHDKLWFSTFGSRVDVHAWGEGVGTLGYGWFATYGRDPNQAYTHDFGGTSSASALVSGAVIALQQRARQLYVEPLSSVEMRRLLVETGTPQGTGGHIGPFVSVAAALAAMPAPWMDVGGALQGAGAIPHLAALGKLEAGSQVQFTLSSVRPRSPCWLVLGASAQDVPFKGGVLVPDADLVLGPWSTDDVGRLVLADTVPSDVVPGQQVYAQFWIDDADAPTGAAASNAVHGSVP